MTTHHVPPDGHPGDHALAPQHTLLLPHLVTEIIMIFGTTPEFRNLDIDDPAFEVEAL